MLETLRLTVSSIVNKLLQNIIEGTLQIFKNVFIFCICITSNEKGFMAGTQIWVLQTRTCSKSILENLSVILIVTLDFKLTDSDLSSIGVIDLREANSSKSLFDILKLVFSCFELR